MIRLFRRNFVTKRCRNRVDFSRFTPYITLRAQFCSKEELAPAYKPSLTESKCLTRVAPASFNISNNHVPPSGKRFNILLPPPNVTGELHLGHALTCAIQDALVRYAASRGARTTWTPGMDHAGIATQVVVEKRLKKERNLARHDLGRERFLQEVMRWKGEKEESIRRALKKLGCSMDWDREYFTMDAQQSTAVKDAFVQLFDKGLIYRDQSLVNWSCSLESAISDIEVESTDIEGPTLLTVPGYERQITFGRMVDIAYKVQGSTEEIVVSTTRPETFLGDVAVAVHPDDGRYSHLQNSSTFLWHPVRKEEIPLIFDTSVDRSFGTGAVKITPAHDRFDFELARKHQLATIEVIDERGFIQQYLEPFSGLPRYEARERLLNYLSKLSLLRGIKPHSMVLPICSRSRDVVELLLRPQWFLRCSELAQRALKAVENGELQIIPKTFEREWFRWLENCHDWCISRQLWWGHQIPAYQIRHGSSVHRWTAARSLEEARNKYLSSCSTSGPGIADVLIEQDTDVLDTWFSSALLPFSTANWPRDISTEHYPLQLMETGHDILFFWVARMVMLGQELTGQLPFPKILLHGIICDEYGRKMSKSLGNVIKPDHVIHGITLDRLKEEAEKSHRQGVLSQEELSKSLAAQRKMFPNGIPECGIDALRFTLCSMNVKNHFVHFNVQEAHTNKLFFNKIWQATRYTLGCLRQFPSADDTALANADTRENLLLMDRWILSRLGNAVRQCRAGIESYNFHLATAALKTFFYNNFCDVYLETTKTNMKPEQATIAKVQCSILKHCLSVGLLHMQPFTPFLAKELQAHLPVPALHLPSECTEYEWIDSKLEQNIDRMLNICQHVRQLKNERSIGRKQYHVVHIYSKSIELNELLTSLREEMQQLTRCNGIVLHSEESTFNDRKDVIKTAACHDCIVGIVADGVEASKPAFGGTQKKLSKLEIEIEKLQRTINSEGYKKSASESVQRKHNEKLNQLQQLKDEIMKLAG